MPRRSPRGDLQTARRVLREINPAEGSRADNAGSTHIVIYELAARMRDLGYEVDFDVGQSAFRCDLAIRRMDERRYRLGIMIDTESFYQIDNVLERDVLRPRLLRNFGWSVVLVLTKDWFENTDAVMKALATRLTHSV